jgi:glycosyltransferase involved in cell wall biosynthesis
VIRVLVDGRIDGHDGIGRYTRCLTGALRAYAGRRVRVDLLPPSDKARYGPAEGEELMRAAQARGADIIHLLDYRVPLEEPEIPLVATVHDLLRLLRPDHCYGDADFSTRFGSYGLAQLKAATTALRGLADHPPRLIREPRSLHEEFCACMLALACARADRIVTPTRAVAQQLSGALGRSVGVRVSPWGIDHQEVEQPDTDPSPTALPVETPGRYLLYVGQARAHKRLPELLAAYEASRARGMDVRLLCIGRDFAAGAHGAQLLADLLGEAAVAVGTVPDLALVDVYQHAEALVHLAEDEGFGFPPLEALAAGIRVIASDIPALRETLGTHAMFVDPVDPVQVAGAIDHLLETTDDAADRRRRIRWAQGYRWCRHAQDIVAVYNEVAR